MKICLINNLYPPNDRGGAEQVVQKIADGLLSAGHKVVVITATPDNNSLEDKGDLRIYRRRPRNFYFYTDGHNHSLLVRFFWHLVDMFHLPMALWVRGVIKKEAPDVVHTHNLMGLSFFIPRLLPKNIGLRVHTVHDTQLVEPSAIILKNESLSFLRSIARLSYSAITKFLVGSPNIVISPSQFLLDFYTSRGFFSKSKRIMLRNPVTFDVYEQTVEMKKNTSPFRFLYVGQIEDHKGIMFLVRTYLSFIATNTTPVELHIVGNGSLYEAVREAVAGESSVRLHGRVNREDLRALFPTMDVLIVPSLCYENSPTVIFESMASGVPILASNIEGIAELITPGENGETFTAGNIDDLKSHMRAMITNKESLAHMRSKTRGFILGLSQKEYIQKLLALYQSRS